jgi:hypothetical protein
MMPRAVFAVLATLPTVWIGPPGVENGKSLRAMFEHPDEWKQTRSMVDGLLYADHNLNRQFSDEDLRLWFSRLREWKLRLGLEVGAIKEWGTTGAITFSRERPMWDRFQSLGGKIYSVAMDEPLLCARKRLNKPDEYAVEETARFIALARERYPEMLIGDIETYPSIPLCARKASAGSISTAWTSTGSISRCSKPVRGRK